jgi:hypothetical protein
MEHRIKVAALLTTLGLAVALVSLLIEHPLAFILFLVVGVTLIGIAIIYYLVSLVRAAPTLDPEPTALPDAKPTSTVVR